MRASNMTRFPPNQPTTGELGLMRDGHHSYAVAVDAKPGREAVAVRRAAVRCGIAPSRRREHARRAGLRARRIVRRATSVVVGSSNRHPFPDVAVHVVQPRRWAPADRLRRAAGVAGGPTRLGQPDFSLPKPNSVDDPAAAGVFPLGLSRQAKVMFFLADFSASHRQNAWHASQLT